jgi:hypothetical protein
MQMLQGGGPRRGYHSCSSVHKIHHAQLGPISTEHVPRLLQGRARLGNRVPLLMVFYHDSANQVEGASLLLFLQ